jgi:hypothetical protein
MTRQELLETIGRLPAAEQVSLAADVLARLVGPGGEIREPRSDSDWEAARRQMAAVAEEAAELYRTDPELTVWTALDGEPFYEYDEGCDLAGGPHADGGGRNEQDAAGPDRQ